MNASRPWRRPLTRAVLPLSRRSLPGGPVAPGEQLAGLVVADDNPTGFADLSHAWRMFADRRKKDRAEKRGRFNVYRDARRWYARDRGETTVRELLTVMDGG